jgi:hypothetical protein
MFSKNLLPLWLTPDRIKPALVTGITLFFVSFGMDMVLSWFGVPAAATILNDVAIGLLGSLLLLFFLYSLNLEQNYRRGKERMTLVAELNHHVRNALVAIQYSASLDDKDERTRRVGEAVERIDRVLMELVPTVASAESPRYFLPELN